MYFEGMRSALLIVLCVVLPVVVPAEASAFHYTHRVTATATLTDNWTIDELRECGALGSGSVSITLKTVTYTKIRPLVDKVGARPIGNKLGLWVLAIPGGGGYAHMRTRKATGTITTVDNTVLKPAWYGDCGPPNTSKCGTYPLKGYINIGGFDPTHIYGKASVGDFRYHSDCQHGALSDFSSPTVTAPGVGAERFLIFKMPSKSSLRKHKKTTLTESDHRATTFTTTDTNGTNFTDDVTRSMTVTFEKL
jgi:hypothetical protein